MDRQTLDLPGQFLQRLQFLEAQHHRVLGHHLRRVEQRTGRVRLLAAADDVGLGLLLGGDDLVQDRAHLAGQDHVLHGQFGHLDAQGRHGLAHRGRVDVDLLGQDAVEGHRPERAAQGELGLAVERLHEVPRPRHGGHGVGDAVDDGQVHADGHAVLGQKLLLRDLQRHAPGVDQRRLHLRADGPEDVRAGGEGAGLHPVHEEHPDLLVRHFHPLDGVEGGRLHDAPRQRLRHAQITQRVEALDRPRPRLDPQDRALLGLHQPEQHPVPEDRGGLARAGAHFHERAFCQLGVLAQEREDGRIGGGPARDLEACGVEPAIAGQEHMLAGTVQALVAPVHRNQHTLALVDDDAGDAQEGVDKRTKDGHRPLLWLRG